MTMQVWEGEDEPERSDAKFFIALFLGLAAGMAGLFYALFVMAERAPI